MSFTDLKKARSARYAATLARNVSVKPIATTTPLDLELRNGRISSDTSEPYEDEDGGRLYANLGESLEIRLSEMGRGIYVKREAKEPIKAGSTILKLRPLVSVLSTGSITSHCSYCHTEAGSPNAAALKRCMTCKVVWYDSKTCQNKDWRVHKYECTALRKWAEGTHRGSGSSEATLVPSAAVRALGRILWNIELDGLSSLPTKEMQQMQTHRLSLGPKSAAHTSLASLGQSLAKYMTQAPAGFSKWGMSSSVELVDFLSRFTTNSFTLTTPSLSPIGVCVSPLAALVNHSCSPNAVVVFPQIESFAQPHLAIVALRDILPGEQVLNSYIDITLPRRQRGRELKETYFFDCKCVACVSPDGVSQAYHSTCEVIHTLGIDSIVLDDADTATNQQIHQPVSCIQCNEGLVPSEGEFRDAINIARESLTKAFGLQNADPLSALKYTSSALSLLRPFPLHPSSDPHLALTRLHLLLSINQLSSLVSTDAATLAEQCERDAVVDEACLLGARYVAGVSGILPHGHPIRGIALAEFGKLLCMDVGPTGESGGNDAESTLPRGAPRLQLAAQVLVRAREELVIGFGQACGGGQVGEEVERMLRELEREMNIWHKAQARSM